MLKLWILMHTHRHGTDAHPIFAEVEPNGEDWARYLEGADYDDTDPENEWLELHGPDTVGAEFYAAYVERNLERIARDGWVPVSMAEYFDSEEYQGDLIGEVKSW